jgi:hypothetical protein
VPRKKGRSGQKIDGNRVSHRNKGERNTELLLNEVEDERKLI